MKSKEIKKFTPDEIKNKIKDTNKINKQLIYLTLKNMIKTGIIIENEGRKGQIIYINKNYIFQPIDKRDTFLSIYDRQIDRKILSDNFINLEIKEKKKEKKIERHIDIKTIIETLHKNKNKLDKDYKELEISGGIKYDFVIERLSFEEKKY